jgi:tRNA-dihydrouridine synthase
LKWKGDRLGVVEMRRHYSNYFKGIPHFKEHRTALVTLDDPTELFQKLDEIAREFDGFRFTEQSA